MAKTTRVKKTADKSATSAGAGAPAADETTSAGDGTMTAVAVSAGTVGTPTVVTLTAAPAVSSPMITTAVELASSAETAKASGKNKAAQSEGTSPPKKKTKTVAAPATVTADTRISEAELKANIAKAAVERAERARQALAEADDAVDKALADANAFQVGGTMSSNSVPCVGAPTPTPGERMVGNPTAMMALMVASAAPPTRAMVHGPEAKAEQSPTTRCWGFTHQHE